MKISFLDFWGDFDHSNNFFLDLLRNIYGATLSHPNEADVVIYTCFGNDHKSVDRSRTKKIFYTGENIRPNFADCDYSFSFDFDSYNNKNIRLPLWMLQLDWFGNTNYSNPNYIVALSEINSGPLVEKKKTKFCCTVFNNLSPYREEVYRALNTYKQVDGYGRPFGNWFYGEKQKLEVLSDYKFNICFENSIYPGYYTEKMIHAKAAGCLPLYWADKNCDIDFNNRSFINLNDYNTVQEFVDKVIELDSDEESYSKIQSQHLFEDRSLSLENIISQIKARL